MSISQRILHRVEKFFLKQGFHTAGYGEESGELVLSNGRDNVLVKVVFEDDADKTVLYEELASIVDKASEYNMVYIAAPRALGESIETASFMKKGVGLILYDDYSVDEKVPAKAHRRALAKQDQEVIRVQFDEKSLRRIEFLIRELSERIDSLEKAYFSLLREVREIKLLLEKRITIVEKPLEKLSGRVEEYVEPSDLPSFLRDNPWVEILSKRPEEST